MVIAMKYKLFTNIEDIRSINKCDMDYLEKLKKLKFTFDEQLIENDWCGKPFVSYIPSNVPTIEINTLEELMELQDFLTMSLIIDKDSINIYDGNIEG